MVGSLSRFGLPNTFDGLFFARERTDLRLKNRRIRAKAKLMPFPITIAVSFWDTP